METLIQFRNRSGKRLRGMLHRPSIRGAAPGVVLFHGFTGDRMESHWLFVKCSRALAEAGIASLRFDFYGSGESEGRFREVTLAGEISDARRAVEFFRARKGIDAARVGLLGLSLGGAIAAMLAAPVRARALVLWSAVARPTDLRSLAERLSRPVAGDGTIREYGAQEVSSRFLDGLEAADPLKAIRRFAWPTLIVHPGKDELLALDHADDFKRSAGARVKEKVIVPGADHTFTSLDWECSVVGLTVDWFRKYL